MGREASEVVAIVFRRSRICIRYMVSGDADAKVVFSGCNFSSEVPFSDFDKFTGIEIADRLIKEYRS